VKWKQKWDQEMLRTTNVSRETFGNHFIKDLSRHGKNSILLNYLYKVAKKRGILNQPEVFTLVVSCAILRPPRHECQRSARMNSERIALDHGSGGEASAELVEKVFLPLLDNPYLRELDDSAVVSLNGGRVAITTDSYVVDPIFFPGGNIGSLAVHGTVNDLSMQGARPLYLTLGLILEEGLPFEDLRRVMGGVARASQESGIKVVAGDTKVVSKGHADKIFINTSGVGVIPDTINVSAANARPGDLVVINGTIADHGISILTQREGLRFQSSPLSDSAPINELVAAILDACPDVHVLRDPTRGGVATALNEIASRSGVAIQLYEGEVPISAPVRFACEMLGLDPLYVANEGKCLIILPKEHARPVLKAMKQHRYGASAALIGEVLEGPRGRVLLRTQVGGTRIVSTMTGAQLPRIC
jgi:hydrogenase expression/formation protein HypE